MVLSKRAKSVMLTTENGAHYLWVTPEGGDSGSAFKMEVSVGMLMILLQQIAATMWSNYKFSPRD